MARGRKLLLWKTFYFLTKQNFQVSINLHHTFKGWLFVIIHLFYKNENWAHLQLFVNYLFTFTLFRFYLFKEPNNLRNRNTFRYNGLIHPKVVGVEAIANGKGVVFTTGSVKSRNSFYFFLHNWLIIQISENPPNVFRKLNLPRIHVVHWQVFDEQFVNNAIVKILRWLVGIYWLIL